MAAKHKIPPTNNITEMIKDIIAKISLVGAGITKKIIKK